MALIDSSRHKLEILEFTRLEMAQEGESKREINTGNQAPAQHQPNTRIAPTNRNPNF